MLDVAGEGAMTIIGTSPALREPLDRLQRVARSRLSLLISGETGTGKELAARMAHDASPRRDEAFEVFDCSSVPPSLINSALFGHERGSFTGAVGEHTGCFERADGGTLFLDEIGELPLDLQCILLRVLESGEIRRVGAQSFRPVDVRIIAATHRDLRHEVRAGRFREDLYYRRAVAEVRLPPLRERRGDIPLLVSHFLKLASTDWPHEVVGLTPDIEDVFASYPWPGNIRELRNVLLRCVVGCESPRINSRVLEKHWPRDMNADADPVGDDVRAKWSHTPAFAGTLREIRLRHQEAVDRRYLRWLFRKCGGNKSQMAREAGANRKTIERMLMKHRDLFGQGDEQEGETMFRMCSGDLLEAESEALVNPVNCVGVMGAGLALQFRDRWPEVVPSYEAACRSGDLAPGQVFVVPIEGARYIIHFPTKAHYRDPSRLEDIERGLQSLVQAVSDLGIRSIAIPALGRGLGGVDWAKIRPLIMDAFVDLPRVRVLLFLPHSLPN